MKTHARRTVWLGATLAAVLVATSLSATGCATKRLEYAWTKSEAMDTMMRYSVWAPRDLTADERLPLVVFLHGGGDNPASFDKFGIGQRLDKALAEGRIPRVVVVVPDGGTGFWENWRDGTHAYRSWVVQDLMPRIQKRYNTLPCPAGCHVMGVSMGGHGTLRFAVEHPDRFATASALSAPVFDTESAQDFMNMFWVRLFVPVTRIWPGPDDPMAMRSRDVFYRWRQPSDLRGVKLLFAWAAGDREGIIETNKKFKKHLEKQKIPHVGFEFKGGHNWVSWGPVIERVLDEQVRQSTAQTGR